MEEYRNTYFEALEIVNDKLKFLIEQWTDLVDEAHTRSVELNQQNDNLGGMHEHNLACVDVAHRSADAMFPDVFGTRSNETKVQLEKLTQEITQAAATNVKLDFSFELEMMRPRLPVAPPLNEVLFGQSFVNEKRRLLAEQRELKMILKNRFQLLKLASETLCEMTKENQQLKMENLYLLSLTVSDENEPLVDLAAHGNINTSLCENRKCNPNGSCHLNESCRYAHGPYQLKIKTCDIFLQQGSCPYEGSCKFLHAHGANGV